MSGVVLEKGGWETVSLCGAQALQSGIALGVTSVLAEVPSPQECFALPGLGADWESLYQQTSCGQKLRILCFCPHCVLAELSPLC